MAVGGGFLCGVLVSEFGEFGSIALWGLGALAGFVSRKITVTPCKGVAWGLVVACAIAAVIAETCWLRWNTVPGQEGWLKAISLLPTFVQNYTLSAAMAVLFTAFGASSAFFQAGRRYRRVVVYED